MPNNPEFDPHQDPNPAHELSPQLIQEIESLDQDLFEDNTGNEQFAGFINMFNQTPKVPVGYLFGSDFVIGYEDNEGEYPDRMRPVCTIAGRLLCRNLFAYEDEQGRRPDYTLLQGCSLFTREDVEKHGWEDISAHIEGFVWGRMNGLGYISESGLNFGSFVDLLVRGGFIAYSPVYSLECLQTQHMKELTSQEDLEGTLLTVTENNRAVPVFIEDDLVITSRIKGVAKKIDDDYVSLLSYVNPTY